MNNMKRISIFLGIILVLLIAGALVFVFVLNPKLSGPPAGNSSNSNNPFGSSTQSQTTQSTGSSLMPITLQDGSTVVVPNFTTQNQPPDASPTQGYYIA